MRLCEYCRFHPLVDGHCWHVPVSRCGFTIGFNLLLCYLPLKFPPLFGYFALFSPKEESAFFSHTTATGYLFSVAMDTQLCPVCSDRNA
jgi:hypothetical protein